MIAVDTNVLVRILVNDDPGQVALARKLLDDCGSAKPLFVSNIVIIELVWVLLSSYRYSRRTLSEALGVLLASPEVTLERSSAVRKAVAAFRDSKADFADCLIAQAALSAGCEYTATFDVDAGKLPGMRLMR